VKGRTPYAKPTLADRFKFLPHIKSRRSSSGTAFQLQKRMQKQPNTNQSIASQKRDSNPTVPTYNPITPFAASGAFPMISIREDEKDEVLELIEDEAVQETFVAAKDVDNESVQPLSNHSYDYELIVKRTSEKRRVRFADTIPSQMRIQLADVVGVSQISGFVKEEANTPILPHDRETHSKSGEYSGTVTTSAQ